MTEEVTPADDLVLALGWIAANLRSLEFVARGVLYMDERGSSEKEKRLDLESLQVGDWVDENPMTDYDSLREVLNECNGVFCSRGSSVKLDVESIVRTRDALAHGRLVGYQKGGPFILTKYSRPRDGQVCVEVHERITLKWAKREQHRAAQELQKVLAGAREIGLSLDPRRP